MKKLISLALSIAIAASLFAVPVAADEEIKIFVDGNQVYTDVPPVMINDRTLAPVRAIGEALGLEVTWNEDEMTAYLNNSYLHVSISIMSASIKKNYNVLGLDVPAQLINDRILIPVRAVAEAFDCNVSYDEITNSVMVYSDTSNVQTLQLDGGAYYIGEVADGFRDGYGKTYNYLGDLYEIGLYKRGLLNGRGAKYNELDGSSYYGPFVGGTPNGIGTYYPDTNKNYCLVGKFVDGLIEGKVEEYDENLNMLFKGNYLHGVRSGHGTEYDVYGNIIYDGEYINGERANNF